MNAEQFRGKWNQVKGRIKEKWGKLTDNDIAQINGRRDQLLGILQTRYGWAKQQAEEELNRFENALEGKGNVSEKYNQEYFKKGQQQKRRDSSEDQDFPNRQAR